MKTPILLNSQAGALHPTPGSEDIRTTAAAIGLDVEVRECQSSDEMRRAIKKYVEDKAEVVVVAGGDGTVGLAVQEVARTETALGIIPMGTANNFATALKLPQELSKALEVIKQREFHHVDLGKVGSRYFTEAAGVGLFADALVLYGPRTGKSLLRFCYTSLKLFLSMHARRVRLTLDGEVHVERAAMCTVANSFRMGLAAPIAPDARVTDGQLDVVVIGDLSRLELITYYRAIMKRAHLGLPKVTSTRARVIKIETHRPMQVHADDKIVGTTPAVITVEARALKVVAGTS